MSALVVGVIYLFFSHGHHNLRGAIGLVVAVILLVLAWWVGRSKSRSAVVRLELTACDWSGRTPGLSRGEPPLQARRRQGGGDAPY